jgi:hypothetical protein
MFEPMFTNPGGAFGLPYSVIVFAVGVALSIVGVVWALRLTEIEPDAHSFRATAPPARDHRVVLIGLGVGILALLAIGLTVTNSWGLY